MLLNEINPSILGLTPVELKVVQDIPAAENGSESGRRGCDRHTSCPAEKSLISITGLFLLMPLSPLYYRKQSKA